jgi:hypothetical protein
MPPITPPERPDVDPERPVDCERPVVDAERCVDSTTEEVF